MEIEALEGMRSDRAKIVASINRQRALAGRRPIRRSAFRLDQPVGAAFAHQWFRNIVWTMPRRARWQSVGLAGGQEGLLLDASTEATRRFLARLSDWVLDKHFSAALEGAVPCFFVWESAKSIAVAVVPWWVPTLRKAFPSKGERRVNAAQTLLTTNATMLAAYRTVVSLASSPSQIRQFVEAIGKAGTSR